VVAIVPTASAGRLSEDVPAHVMLPRLVFIVLRAIVCCISLIRGEILT